MRHDRLQLLATIAAMYYVEGRSQADIARQTGYSRSAVSRLLTEAREQGVVEIRINHPLQRSADLEQALTARYPLRACFVAQRGQLDYPRMLQMLGRLGAAYLSEHMLPDSALGISWGTAIFEVGQALRQRYWPNLHVVQMVGAINTNNPAIDGHELARHIANTFSGKYQTLNAPLIVADSRTKEILLRERNISETLQLAARVDFALVGVGSTTPERSSLLRAGYLDFSEIAAIHAAGAVGDICARHFDRCGGLLDIDINHRVIGIDIAQLRHDDCTVVGVAGGRLKAPAILGALRGALLDVLVTDSTAAELILEANA